MTVKELCNLIKLYPDDGKKMNIYISADGTMKDFEPSVAIELAAYGDFVVSEIGINPGGVEIEIKREFVKSIT